MPDYGSRDHVEDQSSFDHLIVHGEDSDHPINVPTKSRWSLLLSSTIGVMLISTLLILLASSSKKFTTSEGGIKVQELVSSSKMSLAATNEYGQFNGKSYPWMKDVEGTQLVEPYKNTTLTLSGSYIKESYTYVWQITNEDEEINMSYNPTLMNMTSTRRSTIDIVLYETGLYKIRIHFYDSDGELKHSYSTRLVCK